jgi:SAM-dependent methyltransferase
VNQTVRHAPEEQPADGGVTVGSDHDQVGVMVRQAARRNADGVRRGRVDLMLGSAETPPAFDLAFDKILAVNVALSWDRPAELLGNLRRMLRTGGRVAIAFQPRGPGATNEVATPHGQELVAALRDAGFSQVRLETLELKPAVVCALGVNASGESSSDLDSAHGS